MFTLESLQQYPNAVKMFTGLPAKEFRRLVGAVGERWAEAERACGHALSVSGRLVGDEIGPLSRTV